METAAHRFHMHHRTTLARESFGTEGFFGRILNGGHIGRPPLPDFLGEILKRVAEFGGPTDKDVVAVSGQFIREGVAPNPLGSQI